MNQTPEQIARDEIDQQLEACGWQVQSKKQINLAAGLGVAVREYQTDIGPADYVLFVDKKPVGVIEAKREDEGYKLIAMPTLHLRDCQITAINNLDASFKGNKPKALIQMATGSGKTFTAITFIYRLLKYEIESRLSVCDKMEETITSSLQQAEALRQSILKKAFEGKLVDIKQKQYVSVN